jgi:hypothetical protein
VSIFVTSQVWKNAPVKGSDLLVLLALSDFANDDGICWPAMATIADKARISERSAQRACRAMAESGLIEIEENSGPKGANRYRIILGGSQGRGGDKLAPPEDCDGGDKCDAGGVTNTTGGGDTSVTRTVIEPSIEPSRERVRASADDAGAEEGGNEDGPDGEEAGSVPSPDSADFQKRVIRFCNGRGFSAGEWPDWDTSSPGYIRRQFANLSEADRRHAERWRDAYLRDIATRKRKPVPVGVFLRDRLWEGLDPELLVKAQRAAVQGSKPAEHARPEGWAVAMGPVWSACLFDQLLRGPERPELAPDGGLWLAAHLRRAWPRVERLFQFAQMKRGFVAPERFHAAKDAMEFVPEGCGVWSAWESEFKRRGWPAWPRREGFDGMYFPSGGPGCIAAFEQALAGQSSRTSEAAQ